jgi:hypothetical protein
LLLEPQRTNVALNSEQLNLYTAIQGSVTANASTSPDGYTNADKLVADSGLEGILQQLISITAATHTFSAFMKADGLTSVSIQSRDNSSAANFAGVNFNLSTGAVSTISQTGAFSATSGTITAYGNGWYRCTITFTSSISTTTRFRFNTTTGDGTSGVLLYGAQAELTSSYATSYIPTLGTSVTRVADAASKTGISSLIGQTEGTLFLDFEGGPNDSIDYVYGINDGTTSNRIIIFRTTSNTIVTQVRVGGATQAFIETATVTANTRQKCAVAYKLNDVAFYVNGVQIGLDTSATIPTCSVLATNRGDGAALFGRSINQALLFKTRLTNAQLAELTA